MTKFEHNQGNDKHNQDSEQSRRGVQNQRKCLLSTARDDDQELAKSAKSEEMINTAKDSDQQTEQRAQDQRK